MQRSNTKFVTFSTRRDEEIVIFPSAIQHSHMADFVKESSYDSMRPISGGFIVNGECVGESESLRMVSRGDLDTKLITKLLDLEVDEPSGRENDYDYKIEKVAADPVSKNKAKRLRKLRK
jgi:hypothetical protein